MGEKGAEATPAQTLAPTSALGSAAGLNAGLSDNSDLASKIGGLTRGSRPQSTDVSDLMRKDRMNEPSGAPNAGRYPDSPGPSFGRDTGSIAGLSAGVQSGVASPSDPVAPDSIAPSEDVRLDTLIGDGDVTSPYAGTGPGGPYGMTPPPRAPSIAPDPSALFGKTPASAAGPGGSSATAQPSEMPPAAAPVEAAMPSVSPPAAGATHVANPEPPAARETVAPDPSKFPDP